MKERQSNIELLRIISMFFIVLEHILIMGTDFFSTQAGCYRYVANMIIGFTYIGVNCFILITGYFGAEFKWKRVLSLYLICGFYELVGLIVAYYHGDTQFNMEALSYILFPLSHSNIWFIRCYVILLFLLPIINAGLNQMSKNQFVYALIALTALNIYFGWFQKQPDFNITGYTASQMLYVYVIGRYLNRFVNKETLRIYQRQIFIGWIVLAIVWGIVQNIFNGWYSIPHWNGWAYNNPIVLLASILFFAYFCSLQVRNSKWINLVSGSMLAVLLIHLNRYLGSYICDVVRNVIYSKFIGNSIVMQVMTLIAIAVGLVLIFGIIDMPRMWVHKWLLRQYDNLIIYLGKHRGTLINGEK